MEHNLENMDIERKELVSFLLSDDEDDLLDLSSSSDEDEQINAVVTANILACNNLLKRNRTTTNDYIEQVMETTEDDFSTQFRMTKKTFEYIVGRFSESDTYKHLTVHRNSRCNISPEKHILTFLWFSGHETVGFRQIAERFDLSVSSLYDVLTRVITFLSKLAPEFIKFPDHNEQEEMNVYYEMRHGFPNVCGSIGIYHVKIDKPPDNPAEYINSKSYHSVILQGVCNEKRQFTDVFVGFPGSLPDDLVYYNSSTSTELPELLLADTYLLGSSAFPLHPYLLTPYKNNDRFTPAQKYFNQQLSICRGHIEDTFELLVQRFRQLIHIKLKGVERICHFIRACCVLHNICVGDGLKFYTVPYNQPDMQECMDKSEITSAQIRNQLCLKLYEKR